MSRYLEKIMFQFTHNTIEGSVFIIIAAVGVLFSLLTAAINITLQLGVIPIVVSLSTAFISAGMLYYFLNKQDYHFSSRMALTFLILIVFPILWFTNAGSLGPTPYFYIFAAALVAIFLNESRYFPYLIMLFMTMLALLAVEYHFPHLVLTYTSTGTRVLDLGMSYILIGLMNFMVFNLIMRRYNKKITELKTIQDQLKTLSSIDELSGMYSRRYVLDHLQEQISGTASNHSVSLIMFDIDNFKEINDRFGHDVGDQVIRTLSDTLKEHTRTGDIIGRIGTEEFLIILENISAPDASHLAEKLRTLIYNITWSTPELLVTVSGGVYTGTADEPMQYILEQMDSCLYEARNNGQNRIVTCINNSN